MVDPAAPALKLAYRVPGEGAGTRCELTLTRDRRTEQIETSLVFKTVEGMPLPARMLNVFFDADDWLGEGGQGSREPSACTRQGSRDWEALFQGELLDVNLAELVGRRFPRHRLTGRARVAIKQARWGQRPTQGSGWVEVKGELSASQGSIGVDLIEALAREMKFRRSSRLVESRCAQDRGRVPRPRSVVRDAVQRRDPDRGGPGRGVCARGRHRRRHDDALVGTPGHGQRARADQDACFPSHRPVRAFLVPHTAESQVLLSLPVPQGAATTTKQTVDGN